LEPGAQRSTSYQDSDADLDRESLLRKKAERRERYKDDPYYIDSERGSGASTPMHNILRNANGEDLNVDDIPVMELKLDPRDTQQHRRPSPQPARRKPRKHFEIAADETLGDNDTSPSFSSSPAKTSFASRSMKTSLLQVDSSGLSSLSLHDSGSANRHDFERRQAEEEEMQRAIREVERLRLELQRKQERIEEPQEEGTVIKRKKKKKEGSLNCGSSKSTSSPVLMSIMTSLTHGGGVMGLRSLSPKPHIRARCGCCSTLSS
jgi:AP-3 complex subunit delta-1